MIAPQAQSNARPITRLRMLRDLHSVLPRDAFLASEAGATHSWFIYGYPATLPLIEPGDFSNMGSAYCMAMGAAGSQVAIEAAHIALMREDWSLVPQAFRIARRSLRVVKMNIAFTAVYNLVGLSLASLGLLPPIFAAAAQSLPDLGILANSSRLLRQK